MAPRGVSTTAFPGKHLRWNKSGLPTRTVSVLISMFSIADGVSAGLSVYGTAVFACCTSLKLVMQDAR